MCQFRAPSNFGLSKLVSGHKATTSFKHAKF